MRYRLRTLLILLAVLLGLSFGWLIWFCGLWIETPTVKHDPARPPEEAISEYLKLRNDLE